jgi:hypothetical protein
MCSSQYLLDPNGRSPDTYLDDFGVNQARRIETPKCCSVTCLDILRLHDSSF